MTETTWLDVFEKINKGLIKDGTKFYYKGDLYTYLEDDGQIYSNETNMDMEFYLDQVFDTCYILTDLLKDKENI